MKLDGYSYSNYSSCTNNKYDASRWNLCNAVFLSFWDLGKKTKTVDSSKIQLMIFQKGFNASNWYVSSKEFQVSQIKPLFLKKNLALTKQVRYKWFTISPSWLPCHPGRHCPKIPVRCGRSVSCSWIHRRDAPHPRAGQSPPAGSRCCWTYLNVDGTLPKGVGVKGLHKRWQNAGKRLNP